MQIENSNSIALLKLRPTESHKMSDEKIETISLPSYSPADKNSEAGFIDFLIDKVALKIEKVAPAQIISYNRSTNRATVQILNQIITSTGEKMPRDTISNIPVLMLSGGGFTLSFPIKEKDIGWIIAADRNISVFKQLLSIFTPADYRKHKYQDGFFIPDKVKGFDISPDESNAVLLTSEDGLTKISIKNDAITITAKETVLNGNITVNGSISTTGTITSSTDVISAGISGKSHTHGGVEAGGASTGAPQ